MAFDSLGYPFELVVRHFEKRLLELFCSSIMVGIGILLFYAPAAIDSSNFKYLLEIASSGLAANLFLWFGIARIVALQLNGHWKPYGAYVRAVGAGMGSILWAMLGVALAVYSWRENASLTLDFPIMVVATLFEILSIYRALAGVERRGKQDEGRT